MKDVSIQDIVSRVFECLDDSKELLSQQRNEASVNRSYYTMFHSIQALLFTINVAAKSHSGAHNAFHKSFILTGIIQRSLGQALKRTFEMRQFSDYDYDSISDEDAGESYQDAKQFVNATMHYLKENNHLK